MAYSHLGETRRAIQYCEKRLVIARDFGHRRGEGNALGNLGLTYLGETSRAIQFLEQALLIHREIGDRRGEGYTLSNMSLVLDQLGERAQAIQYAEQALTIFEQIEDPLRYESARATCRLARASKHLKLTSSLNASENLSLCDLELALASIVESRRRQL